MSRPSLSTPCPAPAFASLGARRLSTLSLGAQDDTANVEYTRDITQDLTKAKPRRRSTFQTRARKEAVVTIFEDVMEDQELVISETKKETGGGMMFGKAARKLPRDSVIRQPDAMAEDVPPAEQSKSRRRESTLADSIPGLRFKMAEPSRDAAPAETKAQGGLKKDPRRRTIFVPSDNTTMLTIHPGANTTNRLDDTFQLPSLPQQQPAVREVQGQQEKSSPKPATRRPRMSLAVAPKRLPLQQMASEKGNVPAFDVPGQNGGKENLPPRSQTSTHEKKPASRLFAPTAASQARGSTQIRRPAPQLSSLKRPSSTAGSASIEARRGLLEMRQAPAAAPIQRVGTQQKALVSTQSRKTTIARPGAIAGRPLSTVKVCTQQLPPSSETSRLPSTKRCSPAQRSDFAAWKASKLQQYPVLPGDLAQPDLYEDSWLKHQEVALTEVINELLGASNRKEDLWYDGDMSLRDRLVDVYHQPLVSTLYERLQASLQFGALSLPKDASPTALSQDIGLRKHFLTLWLETYDEGLLGAAAEVVVGRQIPSDRVSGGIRSAESSIDPHHGRRGLVSFLETFFVEAQDTVSDPDAGPACWRKTVARSLMFIWLLDQAKTSRAVSGCLFKASSHHKSSTQILNALATLVLPSSVGDITRALGYCDYIVSHQQDSLDEVVYRIANIASDMRDGVFLCRLVETLLYPTEQNKLSQHLKMPCLARAQKLHNVDIALSAMYEKSSFGYTASRTTAEDIVNGHREKTLHLLWSLVSTYGLDALLDFRELMREVRKSDANADVPLDQQYLAQHQQEELLQTWATVICAQQDVKITNLTTSFADGRAYASIVESFAAFNTNGSTTQTSTSSNPQRTCATALRALGCSAAFTASLTSPTATITNRQTTLSNLAFLASRLLPLKRRHNAATAIQRAYRLRRARVVASQRVKLMRVARACAIVVGTRERLVGAAVVLQRAWRGVVDARVGRLEGGVGCFQAVARGWLGRRRVGGVVGVGGKGRVMGGW